MKVSGIDYGLGSPWEIEVPDSAMVIEGPNPDRIPRALENPAQAVRDAIRKPMGMKPLAELVTASSKVTIAMNDWMGVGVHAVPVVLDELREAGVEERNIRIVIAGGLHPKVTRSELILSKVGRTLNPPYPSPFHILSPEIVDRFCSYPAYTVKQRCVEVGQIGSSSSHWQSPLFISLHYMGESQNSSIL